MTKINSERNYGMPLAFGSALIYTAFDVGMRALIGELTIWGLTFMRGFMGLVITAIIAKIIKRRLWAKEGLALAFISGLFTFSSTICTAISVTSIPLYQALVLIYLYPVFTLLLAAPLNNEPLTKRNIILSAMAMFGCALLIWPDNAIGLKLQKEHLIGLTGSFLFSCTQIVIRRMGPANTGLEPMFQFALCAFVCSYPVAYLFGSPLGIASHSGLMTAIFLASLGVIAHLTSFAALRWMPGFKVGLIGTLELFLGTICSWIIFNDPMNLRALAGGVIIVVVAFNLHRPEKNT